MDNSKPSKMESIEKQISEEAKRIEFYTTEYNVELLSYKMQSEELYIPDYQREYNWDLARRSRFVESLLLRLPIPFLFFWEAQDGRLEIVDGSQRLRTIQAFLSSELRLGELDRLSKVSGLTFDELPESSQRRLKNTSIRGIILNEDADRLARMDLFDRINTSALQATPAEIRRGAARGPFLDLVTELAEDTTFRKIAPMTPGDKNRRLDEELISRFFAYSEGLEGYQDKVKKFIADFTTKANRDFQNNAAIDSEYREKFHRTMRFIDNVYPFGFRKTERGNKTYSARFEAISIGSLLALEQMPELENSNLDVSAWLTSEEFERIVSSDGANVRSRLVGRIEFVRDRLLNS